MARTAVDRPGIPLDGGETMDNHYRTGTGLGAPTDDERGSTVNMRAGARTTDAPPVDASLVEREPSNRPLIIAMIAAAGLVLAMLATGIVIQLNRDDPKRQVVPPPIASTQPTAPPSPTVDAKREAAERGALAAYLKWLELDARATREVDYFKYQAQLMKVAGGQALKMTEAHVVDAMSGVEWRGAPRHQPQVVSVTFGKTATVTIIDCLDIRDWEPFSKRTGKSLRPPGQKLRLPIISTVRQVDGNWKAWTGKADKTRTSC